MFTATLSEHTPTMMVPEKVCKLHRTCSISTTARLQDWFIITNEFNFPQKLTNMFFHK